MNAKLIWPYVFIVVMLIAAVLGLVREVTADALTEEERTRTHEVADAFTKALLSLEPQIRSTSDRIVLAYEDYDGKVFCVSLKPPAGKKLSTWRNLNELSQGVTITRDVKECGTVSGFTN